MTLMHGPANGPMRHAPRDTTASLFAIHIANLNAVKHVLVAEMMPAVERLTQTLTDLATTGEGGAKVYETTPRQPAPRRKNVSTTLALSPSVGMRSSSLGVLGVGVRAKRTGMSQGTSQSVALPDAVAVRRCLRVLIVGDDIEQRRLSLADLLNPVSLDGIHFVTVADVQNLDNRLGLEVQARTQPNAQVSALATSSSTEVLLQSPHRVARTTDVSDPVCSWIHQSVDEDLLAVGIQRVIRRVECWKLQWGRIVAHAADSLRESVGAMLRAVCAAPEFPYSQANFTTRACESYAACQGDADGR